MKTIYKYQLGRPRLNTVPMPEGAEILHVGMQQGIPCVWALVDKGRMTAPRNLWVAGTGWELDDFPDELKFLGTAHTDDSLVWHVFEGPGSQRSAGAPK